VQRRPDYQAGQADPAATERGGTCGVAERGKRIQMAQMLCIPLVPIIILIVQACLSLADSVATKVRPSAAHLHSDFAVKINAAKQFGIAQCR